MVGNAPGSNTINPSGAPELCTLRYFADLVVLATSSYPVLVYTRGGSFDECLDVVRMRGHGQTEVVLGL